MSDYLNAAINLHPIVDYCESMNQMHVLNEGRFYSTNYYRNDVNLALNILDLKHTGRARVDLSSLL